MSWATYEFETEKGLRERYRMRDRMEESRGEHWVVVTDQIWFGADHTTLINAFRHKYTIYIMYTERCSSSNNSSIRNRASLVMLMIENSIFFAFLFRGDNKNYISVDSYIWVERVVWLQHINNANIPFMAMHTYWPYTTRFHNKVYFSLFIFTEILVYYDISER